MPIYRQGNMFDVMDEVDHFIITTNAIVKRNGGLVMGAGIAKQIRDMNPGVDKVCGNCVRQFSDRTQFYGVILGVYGKLGIFQVKYHFKDAADLDLITRSAEELAHHASEVGQHYTYALNFPGIGNGKLAYDQVKPIMDILPDNVHVWTFN